MRRLACLVGLWVSIFCAGCGQSEFGAEGFDVSEQAAPLCDSGGLAPAGLAAALSASDTRTLTGLDDVEARIASLADLFADCGDRRGLFPVVYRPITREAVAAVHAGEFVDSAFAERLVVAFARRYLDATHASLAGEPSLPGWTRFDELAANGSVGPLRVAATGVAAHLLLDLPHALVAADAKEQHLGDYQRFGELLVGVTPDLVADLEESYGVDAGPLFGGFFLGDWIDGAFGDDVTTTFVFQTVRRKAWRNRWLMQHGFGLVARGEMAASFATVDAAFAGLDATDVL